MREISIAILCVATLILASCQSQNENSVDPQNSAAIIGGSDARAQDYPFIVNIWQNSPKDNFVDHLCGGSLINKKWVLTAAHCMLEDASETTVKTVNPAELSLIFGSSQRSGQGGKAVKAKSVFVHPEFSWPHHDVALIELSEEVTDIKPVILNTQDLGAANSSLMATVIGWGLFDADGKIDGQVLQKVSVPLISRQECQQDNFPSKRSWTVSADILCARTTQNQKASCQGDSGGPLFLENQSGPVQVGIVSWGSACSGNRFKFPSNAEGYADVANALSWISTVVQKRNWSTSLVAMRRNLPL